MKRYVKVLMGFLLAVSIIIPNLAIPCEAKEITYTVQSGDTLVLLAQRFLGDPLKWRELWKMNPQISNPNLIYVGQVLTVSPQPEPKLSQDELRERIAKFMFKISGLEFDDQVGIFLKVEEYRRAINLHQSIRPAAANRAALYIVTEMRKMEVWLYADAISQQEDPFLLVAIAWKETHFINRRGQAGEISFYQFLPSTLKYFTSDFISAEEDPYIATAIAVRMLDEYKGNLAKWNPHPNYPSDIAKKVSIVKKEIFYGSHSKVQH